MPSSRPKWLHGSGSRGEQMAPSDLVSERCFTKKRFRRSERALGSRRDSVVPRPSHRAEPWSPGDGEQREAVAAGAVGREPPRRRAPAEELPSEEGQSQAAAALLLRGAGEVNAPSVFRPQALAGNAHDCASGSQPHSCQEC